MESIFNAASSEGITLWLESGWAIDARIGQITREHEDIDIAYPAEHHDSYIDLLRNLGFSGYEQMDYGFLMSKNDILIDCEPCSKIGEAYILPGFPSGSCPPEPEGKLNGKLIRCISWQAMYFEFLTYEQEIPRSDWRPKDHESLRLIELHLSTEERKEVERHLEIANNPT
ncbi:nucleotidyltransferase domain-containing protein [Dyadobacter aurulentus]|uniref:nucleotidyltransferase domain-containing protein n=1 Tax=Dyadobacter sp. UC 10 TaxID=2605428 RepID=UPI001CED6658|nr:aminoglycoside nucleotidyltransferase ANT(2'')-Ia [Dyadobacter sp. UC 10]